MTVPISGSVASSVGLAPRGCRPELCLPSCGGIGSTKFSGAPALPATPPWGAATRRAARAGPAGSSGGGIQEEDRAIQVDWSVLVKVLSTRGRLGAFARKTMQLPTPLRWLSRLPAALRNMREDVEAVVRNDPACR